MHLLMWVLAQSNPVVVPPGTDWPSTLISYGAAAPVIGVLVWYLKLSREEWQEQRRQLQDEVTESRKAIQELNDRLLEQQSRLLPITEQSAKALESVADWLERPDDSRRGRGLR